ncbi:peptide deformylase [Bacteroidota bacterium]
MGKILEIAQLGNPILRERAVEVSVINTNIKNLVEDMITTLRFVNGVGISAPQVFKSIRLFVIASHPNQRYPHAPELEPIAVINPVIRKKSLESAKDWEGCLSIPGIRGLLRRSKYIEVEYTNIDGEKWQQTFSDFVARIFLHEYDHLEGAVFLDNLESSRDIITELEFQKLILSSQ